MGNMLEPYEENFLNASKGHKRQLEQLETYTMFLDRKTHSEDLSLLKANVWVY